MTFLKIENSFKDTLPNIAESIRKATEILHEHLVQSPRREANSLMLLALQKDRSFLIAHPEYDLNKSEIRLFEEYVERRSRREPFQHIAGKQEFFGLDFLVSRDVLIPRPETELLVEAGIELLRNLPNSMFCEIGTGSGCISVSILKQLESATAMAFEISEKALQVAAKNAEKHGVLDRLRLVRSDVFQNLDGFIKFDLIVSNPPYIAQTEFEELQPEVRDFDPRIALTDEKDGLTIIRKIIAESPNHLKEDGFLLMEIGYGQSSEVSEMFNANKWKNVEFVSDLQGIPRMVKATLK